MVDLTTEDLRRELFESSKPLYLIDTLTKKSYGFRHLPGALCVPLEELEARADEVLPDKDLPVVAYCASPT